MLKLCQTICEEIKRKVREIYQKRIMLLMKIHLNWKNLFLAINTWTVSVVRYRVAFFNWTKEETKEPDWWT